MLIISIFNAFDHSNCFPQSWFVSEIWNCKGFLLAANLGQVQGRFLVFFESSGFDPWSSERKLGLSSSGFFPSTIPPGTEVYGGCLVPFGAAMPGELGGCRKVLTWVKLAALGGGSGDLGWSPSFVTGAVGHPELGVQPWPVGCRWELRAGWGCWRLLDGQGEHSCLLSSQHKILLWQSAWLPRDMVAALLSLMPGAPDLQKHPELPLHSGESRSWVDIWLERSPRQSKVFYALPLCILEKQAQLIWPFRISGLKIPTQYRLKWAAIRAAK